MSPKPTGPLESVVVDRIRKRLRSLTECYCIKTHGSAFLEVGTPDLLGSYRGRFFAFEVKRPGGRDATPIQKSRLRKWKRAGAIVAVVRSPDEAINILEGI